MSKEIWLFANEFKHRQIIYHWKSFFAMIMNLRLLPKNKAHLVRINWKSFSFLHTKMCRRSGHFRRDRGYHCDKEIKRNLLGPRIAVQLAREWRSIIVNSRPSACVDTRRHRRDLTVVQLGQVVRHPLSMVDWRMLLLSGQSSWIVRLPVVTPKDRERKT